MFCVECGTKLPAGSNFCPKCGTSVESLGENISSDIILEQPVNSDVNNLDESYQEVNRSENETQKRNRIGIVLACIAGFVILSIGGYQLYRTNSKNNDDIEESNSNITKVESETETVIGTDVTGISDTELEKKLGPEEVVVTNEPETATTLFIKTLKNLNSGDASLESINLYANNYKPAKQDTSYKWDNGLFYRLEDISPESWEDGLINGYDIEKKQLINSDTGNLIEYEIYRNPYSDIVNKIVSIEYMDDYLEITDYYYTDDGKINFLFIRKDLNYVPSYAVPTTNGKRYYFNEDVLVKWRKVEDGKQTNYIVGQNEKDRGGNAGSITLYSDLSDKRQKSYIKEEKKAINAAYNTYNIVLNSEGISNIIGYVHDENGSPMTDANISLYSKDYDGVIYECKTGPNGYYSILIPSDERMYELEVTKENYISTTLYNINMNNQMIGVYQETIYLVEDNVGETYNIKLAFRDAFNYATDYNGMLKLDYAAINLRKGINNKRGDVYQSATADNYGEILLTLEPGMYTVEVSKSGYEDTYYTITITKNNRDITINTSPILNDGEVRIVLTWNDKPYDLDSHLFTPYDTSSGDSTYHIWYGNKNDLNYNNLDVDDTDGYGPETMTINNLGNGLYKYYIADFTNCSSGNTNSSDMSFSRAVVDVYTKDGLVQTFHVPANREGVIWEVFEIRNKTIVPLQRYYSNIDNKTWWNNEK